MILQGRNVLKNTEGLSEQIRLSDSVKLNITVTYVPPYTSWTKEKYYETIEGTAREGIGHRT